MIPKLIHYCWFGGGELPDDYNIYIKEWKKINPEFKIMRWDESNSPMDIPYLINAQKHKKWANMSNFVRFHALLKHGGVYLDTDIKLIKPLDSLLKEKCFLGFEEGNVDSTTFWVNNAVIGAVKKHAFIQQCYETLLEKFDGLENANLSAPRLVTQLLKDSWGLSKYGYQKLKDVTLYPIPYFYPIHYSEAYKTNDIAKYIDKTTIAVHMWGRTWLTHKSLIEMFDNLQYEYNTVNAKAQNYISEIEHIKTTINTATIETIGKEVINNESSNPRESIINNFSILKEKIRQIQKDKDAFSKEIEDLNLGQEKSKNELEEKNNVLNILKSENNNFKNELLLKLNVINELQEKSHALELQLSNGINELKQENALLKQNIEFKEDKLQTLDKNFNLTQEEYLKKAENKDSIIKNITNENEHSKQELLKKLEIINDLQNKSFAIELEFSKQREELKKENALLKQDIEFKKLRISEVRNELVLKFKNIEDHLNSKINSLFENEIELKKHISLKEAELNEKEILFQKLNEKLENSQLNFNHEIQLIKEQNSEKIKTLELNFNREIQLIKEQNSEKIKTLELNFNREIHLINENNFDLKKTIGTQDQLINEKSNALIKNENALKLLQNLYDEAHQKREKEVTQNEKDKTILTSSLKIKEDENTNLLLKSELLKEENLSLKTTILLKDSQLSDQKIKAEELENKIVAIENEYDNFREIQKKNNEDLILFLRNKTENYKKSIRWYEATYEKRSILGLIKDRILK